MQVSGGGSHVHHHGLLAGVSAGAAGGLAGLALMLAAWREISHAVGEAVTVIVWALAVAVIAAVAYQVAFLFLRVRHHVAHPETLVRQTVRAEVIPAPGRAIGAIPATAPVAALPPPAGHRGIRWQPVYVTEDAEEIPR